MTVSKSDNPCLTSMDSLLSPFNPQNTDMQQKQAYVADNPRLCIQFAPWWTSKYDSYVEYSTSVV